MQLNRPSFLRITDLINRYTIMICFNVAVLNYTSIHDIQVCADIVLSQLLFSHQLLLYFSFAVQVYMCHFGRCCMNFFPMKHFQYRQCNKFSKLKDCHDTGSQTQAHLTTYITWNNESLLKLVSKYMDVAHYVHDCQNLMGCYFRWEVDTLLVSNLEFIYIWYKFNY